MGYSHNYTKFHERQSRTATAAGCTVLLAVHVHQDTAKPGMALLRDTILEPLDMNGACTLALYHCSQLYQLR